MSLPAAREPACWLGGALLPSQPPIRCGFPAVQFLWAFSSSCEALHLCTAAFRWAHCLCSWISLTGGSKQGLHWWKRGVRLEARAESRADLGPSSSVLCERTHNHCLWLLRHISCLRTTNWPVFIINAQLISFFSYTIKFLKPETPPVLSSVYVEQPLPLPTSWLYITLLPCHQHFIVECVTEIISGTQAALSSTLRLCLVTQHPFWYLLMNAATTK